MNINDIEQRTERLRERIAAWEGRSERVIRRTFHGGDNGAVGVRMIHPSYEAALEEAAFHALEVIPQLIEALKEKQGEQ